MGNWLEGWWNGWVLWGWVGLEIIKKEVLKNEIIPKKCS